MDKHEFRKVRKELGLTQEQMGERLGLSRHTVLRFEQVTGAVPKVVELATAQLVELEVAAYEGCGLAEQREQ